MAGATNSNDGDIIFGGSTRHGTASGDVWVVKLNADGTIDWQKCYGGTISHEGAMAIQQTKDGGYILVGNTSSSTNAINDGDVSGFHPDNSQTNEYGDVWVVKLDNSGVIEWQKCLGGAGSEFYPLSFSPTIQTKDGGYIIAASLGSMETNGDLSGIIDDGRNIWVVKLTATGAIDWQKNYGSIRSLSGRGNDYAYSIQQTEEGDYVMVGGTSSNNNGDVGSNHGSNDAWIVKFDNTGNIISQKCLGGSNSDIGMSIRLTSDGGYIMAGNTYSNDGDVSGLHTPDLSMGNGQDGWVVKLDANFNIEWQKCLGGSGDDNVLNLQQTSDGGYIVAGYSASFDGDLWLCYKTHYNNNRFSDLWIMKLDVLGHISWQKSFGSEDTEGSRVDVLQTTDGGYIMTGSVFPVFSNMTGYHGGPMDAWVVKLGQIP
jgi:hypothetical protein